jgi:hypothetical protein
VQDALAYGTFDDLLVWQAKFIVVEHLVKTGQWSSQGGSSGDSGGGGKDTICHMGMFTLSLPPPAALAHINVHGDTVGLCP